MIQTAYKQLLIGHDAGLSQLTTPTIYTGVRILYNSRAYTYLSSMTKTLVLKHKYKLAGLGCGLVLAPILHISIGLIYNIYKFTYRTYYLYFLLAAIQSNTCNWISTPSVMCLNALINYAFDY